MCHSETTQEATPTSSGTPNIIELSRLHVMIDHLMVRGPKAEQTPLGLRSVPLQGQERETRQQSKSSFCTRQRQGWASPSSHRRGPRSCSGFSCERAVRGKCSTPSWYNAAGNPLGSLAGFLQNRLAESSTRSRSYERLGKSYTDSKSQGSPTWRGRPATKLAARGPRLMSICVLPALSTPLRTSKL